MSEISLAPLRLTPVSPGNRSAFSAALTMSGRCLRLGRRNPDALVSSVSMPVLLLLLFVYLFGGAIHSGETKYIQYVVPGVLLLAAAFSSALTAVSVTQDMAGGTVDRFRSMGISGASLAAGHVAASVARNTMSSVLVIGVAYAIGFRPHANALQWVGAAVVILAFVLAMTTVSVAIGMLTTSAEAASSFTFFAMFLPYASSAFVPVSTMPGWIQGFARYQPVNPAIETIRGLLMGGGLGTYPLQCVAWYGGIIILATTTAALRFRRRVG